MPTAGMQAQVLRVQVVKSFIILLSFVNSKTGSNTKLHVDHKEPNQMSEKPLAGLNVLSLVLLHLKNTVGKNPNDGVLPLINNDRHFCCLCSERSVTRTCTVQ